MLSSDLPERIGEVAVASSSSTRASETELIDDDDGDDGVPDNEEVDCISEQIAIELNAQINLPVLDEEQKLVIFQSIGGALMAVLTTSDEIAVDFKHAVDLAVRNGPRIARKKGGGGTSLHRCSIQSWISQFSTKRPNKTCRSGLLMHVQIDGQDI